MQAPAVRIRRRCDTSANFDYNQFHLTPSPARPPCRRKYGRRRRVLDSRSRACQIGVWDPGYAGALLPTGKKAGRPPERAKRQLIDGILAPGCLVPTVLRCHLAVPLTAANAAGFSGILA
jgi:hypothetical protein